MNNKQQQPKRMHHFLVAGEIVFKPKDIDQVGAMRLNAAVVSPDFMIPARMLGRAQQALQMMFHKRQDVGEVEVLDVIIMNMVHLGHMTEREFHEPPEGTELQERAEAVMATATGSNEPAKAKPELKVVGKSTTVPANAVKEYPASASNPFGLSPEELAAEAANIPAHSAVTPEEKQAAAEADAQVGGVEGRNALPGE